MKINMSILMNINIHIPTNIIMTIKCIYICIPICILMSIHMFILVISKRRIIHGMIRPIIMVHMTMNMINMNRNHTSMNMDKYMATWKSLKTKKPEFNPGFLFVR